MSGISSQALNFGSPENKKKYNGIEKENDLQIEIYDAQLRELDGQVGRWWEVDPKTENMEMWSPYASNYDNPMRYSDPLGDEGQACCLTGVLTWLVDLRNKILPNGDAKAQILAKEVKGAVNQGIENFKSNWDAKADPFHQIVDQVKEYGPMSLLSGIGPLSMAKGALRMEAFELKALSKSTLNEIIPTVKNTEKVQRAMSIEELHATQSTGLVRGGREGTHHVSNAISNDAKRATQRLALDKIPEVKVTLEVPKGSFSNPTRINPTKIMPGGGMERKATGNIPAKVVNVNPFKNIDN